jgi:uncharacterized repeat protein (TIGR03803 family)
MQGTTLRTRGCVFLIVAALTVLSGVAWATTRYQTLHRFNHRDGDLVFAGLIFDGAGNLFGTTMEGGDFNDGVVFKLTPNADGSWTYSELYSFTGGMDGAVPFSGVVMDGVGNLYGAASGGGAHKGGVIFKLSQTPAGAWAETTIYSFNVTGKDGNIPESTLIFDAMGNLYGTTREGGDLTCGNGTGCGVVFKLAQNADGSRTESVLHRFSAGGDGAFPNFYAGLTLDQAGALYGATLQGGGGVSCEGTGCGVIFKMTSNADGSWRESVVYRFDWYRDGGSPSGVILDGSGNLYGSVGVDSLGSGGNVFELTPGPHGVWQHVILHEFSAPGDGIGPLAPLVFDKKGKLYGTTYQGGSHNWGIVFELEEDSNGRWTELILHNFHDRPGVWPVAPLIFDPVGNLFGTSSGDNSISFGSVFEIVP